MATSYTEGRRVDDVVRMELPQAYCREVITLDKAVAAKIGSPLDLDGSNGNGGLIANGAEANADAIALENVTAPADATAKCLALVRGPAIVDGDQLELAADVTKAELKAPLKAIGIMLRDEPTITETQST
jgi:hypothetical protein